MREYYSQVTGRKGGEHNGINSLTREVSIIETILKAKELNGDLSQADKVITKEQTRDGPSLANKFNTLNSDGEIDPSKLPT